MHSVHSNKTSSSPRISSPDTGKPRHMKSEPRPFPVPAGRNQTVVTKREPKPNRSRLYNSSGWDYQGPLTQANDESQLNKTKIVGFTTDNYAKVAIRWYDRLRILGYSNHFIVVVEQETYDMFTKYHPKIRVELILLPEDPTPKEVHQASGQGQRTRRKVEMLFAVRWRYLMNQLSSGFHVLITDVDNIWNSYYPMSQLELSQYDVYHALETKHPADVYTDQGFVFCGGMGWFRSSPRTMSFIQKMLDACGVLCDDQELMNRLIAYQLNMAWNRTEAHHNETTKSLLTHEGGDPTLHGHVGRITGIVTRGFSGYSRVTGHTVMVWDRNVAYRGENTPLRCPQDNWVSMPFVKAKTRSSAPIKKLSAYDLWDQTCPNQYTQSEQSKDNGLEKYQHALDGRKFDRRQHSGRQG